MMCFQVVSTSPPSGLTMPRPVTTTRRICLLRKIFLAQRRPSNPSKGDCERGPDAKRLPKTRFRRTGGAFSFSNAAATRLRAGRQAPLLLAVDIIDGILDGGDLFRRVVGDRSEERRVGKECVSTCRSRWSPCH